MTDQTFAASPTPDPSIAPSEPAGQPPADRWVRYLGDQAVTVIDAGRWEPDSDPRLVPGWLAARLLRNPLFAEATEPAPQVAAVAEPADEPAVAVAEPAADPDAEQAAPPKPARTRTTK